MSDKISPPFEVVPRISEAVALDPDRISLKRLREVVTTGDVTFPRAQAMAFLLGSDFPNKHRDFEAVLENEEESSRVRYLAAINLGKINTPAASEVLIKNSEIRDERVLAGIMRALGRVGDKSALDVVERVKEYATGLAASQAKFAAGLISHRLGLEGNELSAPDESDYLKLPDGAAPLHLTRGSNTDAELCLRSLAAQPLGIEFSEYSIYQVRCGRFIGMILFNRDFTGQDAVEQLRERKAFPGVVATRDESTGTYSATFLLLTSPAKRSDTLNILIHRPNGDLVFGGTAQVDGNRAAFAIRAISRPGAFPIEVEGIFGDGKLEIKTALSAQFVRNQRQPMKGLKHASTR